jgi:hypothetical protein
VYLDVVRMAIATMLIIAGDDVRVEFPDEVHQASRGLVEVCLGQALGMVIGVPSHHTRVTVAEDMELLDLQMFARALEFRGPHIPKFRLHLCRIHLRIYHLALFPTRGRD